MSLKMSFQKKALLSNLDFKIVQKRATVSMSIDDLLEENEGLASGSVSVSSRFNIYCKILYVLCCRSKLFFNTPEVSETTQTRWHSCREDTNMQQKLLHKEIDSFSVFCHCLWHQWAIGETPHAELELCQ